jgi:hypothetical protein
LSKNLTLGGKKGRYLEKEERRSKFWKKEEKQEGQRRKPVLKNANRTGGHGGGREECFNTGC